MMGEYRVMGVYPRGHLMEFVRPGLDPNVLPTVDVERCGDDQWVTVAGWPVARQHPRGRDGTVFVTIEDETGDVQVIVWSDLFARRRMELGSQVVKVTGRVSRWDGTTNVIATDLRAVPSGVSMPPSHDWHCPFTRRAGIVPLLPTGSLGSELRDAPYVPPLHRITMQESRGLGALTSCPATSRRSWYLPYTVVGLRVLNCELSG